MPIFEPVEILSYGSGTHWFIKFSYNNTNLQGHSDINCIKEIGLKDSILVVKSGDISFRYNGENQCPSWLILNFKTKTEKIILSQQELENEIKGLKLKNIDTLFMKFNEDKDSNGV